MLRKSFSKFLSSGGANEQSTPPDHQGTLSRLQKSRSSEPLYKRHDDYLQGPGVVADKFEDKAQRQNMSRWRLGRYVPPVKVEDPLFGMIDPLGSMSSPSSGISRGPVEINPTSYIVSSQLKEHILNRYVQAAEEEIARREYFDLTEEIPADPVVPEAENFTMDATSNAEDLEAAVEPVIGYDRAKLDLLTMARIDIDDEEFEQVMSSNDYIVDAEPEGEKFSLEQLAYDETAEYDPNIYGGEKPFEMVREWQPPSPEEPTGWQGMVERRRRLMQQALAFSASDQHRDAMAETADFAPYVVPAGECLLPWGSELLADERGTCLQMVSNEASLDPFRVQEPEQNEFVDDLDYIRYIFSQYAELPVLQRIAESSSTPSFVLAQLAFHPDVRVRSAVAENSRTPMEALWFLVLDESDSIRSLLADCEHIPLEVLKVLSKDENPHIAERAHQTATRVRSKVISAPFGKAIHRKAASS